MTGVGSSSSYSVYQDGTLAKSISTTQVTISGLKSGTEYNFTVAAHNTVGDSAASPLVSATPLTQGPSVSADALLLIAASIIVVLAAVVLLLRRARSHE